MKKINVKGFIIPQEDKWMYDWFDYPYTCAEDVNNTLLEANGDDIEVLINSYGGAVHVGSEIYTSLKDYPGNVTVKIVGLAASAASVVAMGGNKCLMSPTAQMMLHNAATGASGDYRVMDKTSKVLQVTNKSILNAYKLKTGLSEEDITAFMDEETWLTAERAKELNFIDEIMFENEQKEEDIAPILYNSLPIPSLKALEEMKQCGSVAKFKEQLINNKMKIETTGKTVVENKLNKISEGGKQMDLNTLKNEHKEIYDEIVLNATNAERERIKAIEDLAIPGNEDIINAAKFETGITAEALAIQIIKNEKNKGKNYLENREKDIENSNVNKVRATDTTMKSEKEEIKDTAEGMANFINQRRVM
ncbi:head maturation protease, ClpP-related [Hathewaya massiliensis]|uniref:head maturation protease, ClpP-related n=1 Tax=Hathewaya massiliensis TaxID=1964382 RepID=UPI001157C765|nr:head maturation protease, ClpP-related [Hathewaya massiliensis]